MPEHDNDRLEQFFKKAAGQPDIPFDESNWRKLEARLDAQKLLTAGAERAPMKLAVATGIVLLLLFCGALWMNYLYNFIPVRNAMAPSANTGTRADERPIVGQGGQSSTLKLSPPQKESEVSTTASTKARDTQAAARVQTPAPPQEHSDDRAVLLSVGETVAATTQIRNGNDPAARVKVIPEGEEVSPESNGRLKQGRAAARRYSTVERLDDARIVDDLINVRSVIGEGNRQKAAVALPGAEEVETNTAAHLVSTDEASDSEDRQRSPRLSLLLSFAPDFSGTSLGAHSAPGKAFGAEVHYHILKKWSVSAGVIKNNKQYSGNGEDYHPPHGYWEYYTNGRIPNSINGACTVLEFPFTVHYTIAEGSKNSFRGAAGVSSYLMLDESYQYIFDEPNPGAKAGWSSRGSTRFLFNMVNFSMGYERQVLPGFRIGIAPYVKIPVSKIGWSNLKLFSTGASVTLRYTLVRQKAGDLPTRSRGPD